MPPWNSELEPSQGSIRHWLDNLYSKFQPIEQARWNQSHIDSMFYAGAQTFVNQYFNFSPRSSYQQYYFNLIQQPVNLITGYQRQHRKSLTFTPIEGAEPKTTDQYTKLVNHLCVDNGLYDAYSRACELATVSGMVLMQPYLDYTEDPAQGDLRLKVWEYNSFMVDPYFRQPDMSDAQFVWCQEYISKQEAVERFPDRKSFVQNMTGMQRQGRFYFLPENYNMARNDLLVLSYVWYKWKKKEKKLYSPQRKQFFDFAGGDSQAEEIIFNLPDLEIVEVEVPCWKLACILNDTLMYQGDNPLGFNSCPFVPVFWNYDPQLAEYNLRVRGLVRTMRDPQFLFNHKVIVNNDIAAATINAGWKRKIGAVANEDNLKKSGQGYDVLINEGYELADCEKIGASGVPQSDLELGQQMEDLVFKTSGINLENWAGQEDSQISSLTLMMKQAANLMVFQKYFDQWDHSFKLLGDLMLKTCLYNWNAEKISMLIGEDPTPFFFSRIFAKYQTVVEEGLLTPTQKNLKAQAMLDINQSFGREVFPPSMVIPNLNVQGIPQMMEFLQGQEQNAQSQQQEQSNMQMAFAEAELQNLYAKAASEVAMARERHSRSDSNVGLFEERLSELQKNQAISLKEKMEALQKLVETIQKFGEVETFLRQNQLDQIENSDILEQNIDRRKARNDSAANEFLSQILGNQPQMGNQPGGEMRAMGTPELQETGI